MRYRSFADTNQTQAILLAELNAAGALDWFRRLRIRWEIRDDIHEAFLSLTRAIICWRRLRNLSPC